MRKAKWTTLLETKEDVFLALDFEGILRWIHITNETRHTFSYTKTHHSESAKHQKWENDIQNTNKLTKDQHLAHVITKVIQRKRDQKRPFRAEVLV